MLVDHLHVPPLASALPCCHVLITVLFHELGSLLSDVVTYKYYYIGLGVE